MTNLVPGYALQTMAEIQALPRGTILTCEAGYNMEIGDDGCYTQLGDGGRHPVTGLSEDGYNTIVSIPLLNERITFEDANRLRAGSVITWSGPSRVAYTKIGADGWQQSDARITTTAGLNWTSRHHYFVLTTVSDGTDDPPGETIEAYRERFRTEALIQGARHGISIPAVQETLRQLNLDNPEPFIGQRITMSEERRRLPEGTVLVVSPDHPEFPEYSWWMTGDRMTRIIGTAGTHALSDYPVHILALPGQSERPAWMDRPPTAEDMEAIARFKSEAWVVGRRAKLAYNWCSAFEAVMRTLGITADSVIPTERPYEIGTVLRSEEQSRLPAGSVLLCQQSAGRNLYVIRVDGAGNPSGTLAVFGWDGNGTLATFGQWSESATLVAYPNSDPCVGLNIPISAEMGPHLPIGTVIGYGEGSNAYRKMADGEWLSGTEGEGQVFLETGRPRIDVVGMFIKSLPTPETIAREAW